ncbi:acetyl-CoA carboxylase [Paucilactobacillus sp. N302-9]
MEKYIQKATFEIKPQDEVDLIIERIKPLFKRLRGHRYHVLVVNARPFKQINFFFEDDSQYDNNHSIPLHTLKNDDLEYFETVMKLYRRKTNLSVKLRGFQGLKWPSNDKHIQRPKDYDKDELKYT